MPSPRCPICGKSFEPSQSTAMPFCCPRCRDIDLGRWLSERYTVPNDLQDPEELEEDRPPLAPGEPPEDEDG